MVAPQSACPKSAADRLDRRLRPAAVRRDQAGAFPPGLRPRAGRPPRRDRRDRRQRRAAELRQHHRGAGEERARARPRRQCLLRAGRRRYQRRDRGDRARSLAAARPPQQRALSQSRALCPHCRPLCAGATALGLNAEQARVLDRYHTRFVRAGGALDKPAQDRLAAINERLASLGTQFGQNVLADEKSYAMVLEEGDLAGLPDFARAAARAAAEERGASRQICHHPGAFFVRDLPAIFLAPRPAREDLPGLDQARRERRGHRQPRADRRNGGACAPSGRSCSALQTFADYRLDDQMAKTPAAARKLLDEVWGRARAKAQPSVTRCRR